MQCACSGGQGHWWHFSGLSWLLRGLTPTPTKAVPSWANFGPKALCYTMRVSQLCLEILWHLLFNSIQIQWKHANKCLISMLSDLVKRTRLLLSKLWWKEVNSTKPNSTFCPYEERTMLLFSQPMRDRDTLAFKENVSISSLVERLGLVELTYSGEM